MLRLAEYFVVVGFDFDKSKRHEGKGKVIQRLPKTNWHDYKYETQVEMFCQPCGWELSTEKKPPTFFVCYLTDTEARIYYLACLTFHEAVSESQLPSSENKHNGISTGASRHVRNPSSSSNLQNIINGERTGGLYLSDGSTEHDDDQISGSNFQEDPNLVKPAKKFAPKSLVLLARHGYFDILKNCLSIIYSIYMDSHREISLEYVISNILSSVDVPPIGGNRISFTVGAGDKQVVQPPVCPTLPVTRNCISMLFKHLGMQNVLLIFCSLINDHKILLYSRSLNRLTEACHAFRSLLYPLKYGNVFIPIIPKPLIDVLSTPTPFLAGIHSDCRPTFEMVDVITVDLDGGSVIFPSEVAPLQLNEPYYSIVIDSLTKILNPDLLTADEIYPPEASPPPDPIWQDKQLRAVFIRLFCRLFAGYRSCLTLTRIRPKPVIHFNQLIFLLLRGLRNDNDEFVTRLLNCMSFGQFIQDRGTPYRVCDVFDEEYDSMTDLLRRYSTQLDELPVIDRLAKKLYDHENRGTPVTHQLPPESKSGHTRLHAQPFQLLDETLICDHIKTNLRNKPSPYKADPAKPRFVAHGLELDMQIFKNQALSDKNKVIREFVASIFNNHITEALKRRNTVRQDLKNRLIRRIFIDELYRQLHPESADGAHNLLSSVSNTTSTVATNASGQIRGHQYKPSSSSLSQQQQLVPVPEMSCERRALLEYQQFELVNDLMCEALRQEGQNEDSGVAPIIMDLSTKFCTQLGNIRYYSNMTWQIQQHPVWESQKFWINCFCDRVDQEIRQLYLHHSESQYRRLADLEKQAGTLISGISNSSSSTSGSNVAEVKSGSGSGVGSGSGPGHFRSNSDKSWSHNAGVASHPSLLDAGKKPTSTNVPSNRTHRKLYTNRMSALDMAAEEMRMMESCQQSSTSSIDSNNTDSNATIQHQEVSTIYAQILHFINLIVNFRIPLNIVERIIAAKKVAANTSTTAGVDNVAGGDSHHHHHHHQPQQPHVHFGDDDMSIDSNVSGNGDSEASLNDDARWVRNKTYALEIWLKKFVDKTASDNNLDSSMIETKLKSKIEGIIEGHISNLEAIYPEVQNIPKVKKVAVTSPVLLPDEQVILICNREMLRCQLLLDGRHERLEISRQREQDFDNVTMGTSNLQSATMGGGKVLNDEEDDYDNLRPLLPAQGALFVTNYRIVFRGAPKDPYQSNKLVCRSFPIASLQSIKKIGTKTFSNTGQMVQTQNTFGGLITGRISGRGKSSEYYSVLDVIRIRSNNFQMLKLGFDQEDGIVDIKEELTNKLMALRYPSVLMLSFNMTDRIPSQQIRSDYITGLPDNADPLDERTNNFSGYGNKNTLNRFLRLQSTTSSSMGVSGPGTYYTGASSSIGGKSRTSASESGSEISCAVNEFTLDASASGIASTNAASTTDQHGTFGSSKEQWWFKYNDRIKQKLFEKPGYRDLLRALHMDSRDLTSKKTTTDMLYEDEDNLKIHLSWEFNQKYDGVPTYPAMLAVPSGFNEMKLRKVAKCHKKGRFPVIIWKNNKTGSLLIRGSCFQSKRSLPKFWKNVGSGGNSAVFKNMGATLHRGLQSMTLKPTSTSSSIINSESNLSTKPLSGADQEITTAKEQIRYLQDLVRLSPSYDQIQSHLEQFSLDDNGDQSHPDSEYRQKPLAPWTEGCRKYQLPGRKNPLDRVVKNIKAGSEKAKTGGRRRGSRDSVVSAVMLEENEEDDELDRISTRDDAYNAGKTLPSNMSVTSNLGGGHLQAELRVVPLYVLGDKSMKTFSRCEGLRDIEFIQIEYANKKQIKEAFDSLLKVCLPDIMSSSSIKNVGGMSEQQQQQHQHQSGGAGAGGSSSNTGRVSGPTTSNTGGGTTGGDDGGHNSLVAGSAKWLQQVQSLLQLAGTTVDLMELQGASVAVCLESGWDTTAQIVSLAQIMMDPYYRTLEGLWSLIEKDWICMGHPFRSRMNLSSSAGASNKHPGSSETSGTTTHDPINSQHIILPPPPTINTAKQVAASSTPVFLQFLDALHQLMAQFPLAFQYNEFLLRFIAYHHIGNRFHDFKCDSEFDRLKWLFNTIIPLHPPSSAGSSADIVPNIDAITKQHSILEYIRDHHQQWPIFFNFHYCPLLSQKILRPCTSMSVLSVWRYFLDEDLSSGSIYDLDHFCPRFRRRNSRHYDPVLHGAFNNSHVESIYGIMGLREGAEPGNWLQIWQSICGESEKDLLSLSKQLNELEMEPEEDGTLKSNPISSVSTTNKIQSTIYDNRIKQTYDDIMKTRHAVKEQHRISTLRRLDKRSAHTERSNGLVEDLNPTNLNDPSIMNTSGYQGDPSINNPSGDSAITPTTITNASTAPSSSTHINRHRQQGSNVSSQHPSHNTSSVSSSSSHTMSNTLTNITETPGGARPQRPPPPKATPIQIDPSNNTSTQFKSSSLNSHSNHFNHPTNNSHTERRIPGSLSGEQSTGSEIAFSGELYKLNHAIFPSWQKKYFALDVIHHAIFYYDLKDSVKTNRKRINLQDITGVRILTTMPNHQKRFPESAFLELQTEEKVFRLASDSAAAITEWVEKIQTSIQ